MSTSPQAKDVFFEALNISAAEERALYLDDACGQDVELRCRVEALLAAHDDPESYLERPAARFDVTATQDGNESGSNLSDSSSHHGRFLPGTKLAGRYRIVSLLGRGGMGEVYRADDLKLGQTVGALKFLPSELANDDKRLEYFHNEVRLARQVSHPNVCRVYDIGEVDGLHFISMEYIDGEDLKTLLRRIGRLPNDKGAQIAQQLCSGLAAAHAKGVLHRDLKPANIMLDGQGQVRITDFGLATISAESDNVVGMSGTPAYMAPEQLLNGKTNVSSDIYSLGLVIYEVFTGKQVHEAESVFELRQLHAKSSSPSDPGDIVEDLDVTVRRGLMRCLSPDPADRPRSVDELAMWLPGGDPLAAALAAGETPSPEMVANARSDSTPSARLSYLAAVLVIIGLGLIFVMARHSLLLEQLDTVHSPEVLRNKSLEMMRKLGYEDPVTDEAFGFESPALVDATRLDEIRASNAFTEGLWFWHRTSPVDLESYAPFDAKARVSVSHPAWDTYGMNGTRLDVAGNLRWFRHVSAGGPLEADDTEPQWNKWFNAATIGFNLDELKKTDATRLPLDPFDSLQAWQGKTTALGDVHVTAASYGGQPVFLEVSTDASQHESKKAGGSSFAQNLTQLVVCIVAFFFAMRNIAAGRIDRRGAWTFATTIVILELAAWTLGAHHVLSSHAETIFWLAVGNAVRAGAIGGILYLAIEPLIRRIWPSTMVTFSRLLRGNWNDPWVAQDILMGVCFGVWCAVFQMVVVSQCDLLFGVGPFGGLIGGRTLLADIVTVLRQSLLIAMGWPVTLLLLELVLRSRKGAVAVWIVVFTLLFGVTGGTPMYLWFLQAFVISGIAYVYSRHGILGNASLCFAFYLMTLPITPNASVSYFESGLLGVGIVIALTAFALVNALRSKSSRLPSYV